MSRTQDLRLMSLALAQAWAQLGRTTPNPSVGCVLAQGDRIIATGATADRGRPHAERVALDKAGAQARGATAYVTLEPCAHHGQTPPCAEALVEAGVARVVIACHDHDPRVSGKGVGILQSAGIETVDGFLADLGEPLYSAFFHRLKTGRASLFLDRRTLTYEATATSRSLKALDQELTALGEKGISRVRLDPSDPLAQTALAAGRVHTHR
ncbi:bifunctional diaminohydroxyphosphoribosylaminopyrimidine deaminase/5-amino-6-(5-phosphoribosylamino)uracil reductase RibD [Maricaulis sp.]|uniref:bifunctional diaminohydroxyphosphoribosylaminopyrimidine deaminase/5-amino-6-(5-phosphoribosylamino)uracil reductase RibD n=1 Tax=Maricaulis sp. TaxID=1486257 RepID=UPI00261F5420|nr:bifunctional diaminohydroxyphosphoribosylaminopyrimidine deaminase/5-amino-6-(5-phosphoribosylamino)uracil reductase RibD [Maricaulis sp.]